MMTFGLFEGVLTEFVGGTGEKATRFLIRRDVDTAQTEGEQ